MDLDEASLPSVQGTCAVPINILLINPNSSAFMTENCLKSIADKLPAGVTVHGFTAPHPAPSAIESKVDAVLSSEACLRAIAPIKHKYDAFLVACFSKHALIDALREEVDGPVIGIMEAALYASRMCGNRLGIITTSERSEIMHQQSIAEYGFGAYSAGCAASKVSVLGLESRPREEVYGNMMAAARELAESRGADCICLGCAGMTGMKEACEEAVDKKNQQVMVVDGVGTGIQFLIALVREGLGTAKRGVYRPAEAGRVGRGQTWY